MESKINHVFNYAEVTVYAPDQPGLFSDISGVMALTNVNIVGAKISTRSDGMVLDTFAFLDASNQPTTEQNKINRLILALEDLLSGQFNVSERFRGAKKINKNKKPKPFNVASRVLFDNNASSTNTVLEINGRDRMGLLYELTKALTDLGLKISSAHITTFGVEVVDTFYIKDSFGLKVTHHKKQKKIREELIRIVNSK